MRYFNNPKTEEELKDQYRRLLIKYDYRSEKNAKIIEEIRKEYNAIQMQIKRANGYRTMTEKVVDGVKDIHASYVEANQAEEQRIRRLKNHVYTKQEIQKLIDETKQCATKIIYDIVKRQLLPYVSLRKVVTSCDPEQICRWFNTNAVKAVNNSLRMPYDEVREKLEYALKSQSNDKKSQETFMVQMEKMLGNHISLIFNKYESELIDPIVVTELNMQKYEQNKNNKKYDNFWKILFVVGWLISCIYIILEVLTNKYIDLVEGLIFIVVSGILEYTIYFLMVKVPRKVEKALNKKTFAGIGNRKHNSRVSEKRKYQSDVTKNSLIRIIVRFLGF